MPSLNSIAHRAASQWAERPMDERYWTVDEMFRAAQARKMNSREKDGSTGVRNGTLRAREVDGDLALVGPGGSPVFPTHYAFGQLASRAFPGVAGAASFLRALPAHLAAQNLNHGLSSIAQNTGATILLTRDLNAVECRAITSESYARVWDADILEREILPLGAKGWSVPPARPFPNCPKSLIRVATEADVLHNGAHPELGIKVGDPIAPAGLYLSDRDMFAFLVYDERRIEVPGYKHGLTPFLYRWNSEVGLKSNGLGFGLLDTVCGNHILWGLEAYAEARFRHVGRNASKAELEFGRKVLSFSEIGNADLLKPIKTAMATIIAPSRDETVQALYRLRQPELTQSRLEDAWDACQTNRQRGDGRYGDPNSLWGMVNGLTEVSQSLAHQNERTALDRAAGRLLSKLS